MPRQDIVDILRRSGPVSGEELGRTLGISRTAVWKHINELRREGYRIDSAPSKGYYFVGAPDALLPQEIRSGLGTLTLGREIVHRREAASTQAIAKSLASLGAIEGTIVVAETQSEGRGRMGREWASPQGGIYFSAVLRPQIQPTEALRLPLTAGVAVARAIRRNTDLNIRLKWPNDVMLNGKKTGGILTEMGAETDRLDWVVIGIGLNVNTACGALPAEVEGIATSLAAELGESIPRVDLLRDILVELESLYNDLLGSGFESIRAEWKALSDTIGAHVAVTLPAGRAEGLALDIDADGALLLRVEDGTIERVIAGMVIVKES